MAEDVTRVKSRATGRSLRSDGMIVILYLSEDRRGRIEVSIQKAAGAALARVGSSNVAAFELAFGSRESAHEAMQVM